MQQTHKKYIQLIASIVLAISFHACGVDSMPSGESSNPTEEVEEKVVKTYSVGESVSISTGDTYRALTQDTAVTMVTNPETEETTITVDSGQMEVTFN
jgi:hypothetical protein